MWVLSYLRLPATVECWAHRFRHTAHDSFCHVRTFWVYYFGCSLSTRSLQKFSNGFRNPGGSGQEKTSCLFDCAISKNKQIVRLHQITSLAQMVDPCSPCSIRVRVFHVLLDVNVSAWPILACFLHCVLFSRSKSYFQLATNEIHSALHRH